MNFWRRSFFTEPILILFFVFCFLVGLFYHYRDKVRLLFLLYFFSGIILFVPVTIIRVCRIFTEKQTAVLHETVNTIFELTEFVAFYYFFQQCLQNNKLKKVLRMCLYFLLAIMAIFFSRLTFPGYPEYYMRVHSLFINVVEFFFLFIMCLAYYRELFTGVPIKNLFQRPSFFIVTSTFFYTILMIPFFLIAHDVFVSEIEIYDMLFSCHFVVLMVLLFSISKAFLCKIPITT
jgi:hypothetical protein